MDSPVFVLRNWSFSDRKWMERGRFDSASEAVEFTKTLVGGYYRIDDTNYGIGEIFFTGSGATLYPRNPSKRAS